MPFSMWALFMKVTMENIQAACILMGGHQT